MRNVWLVVFNSGNGRERWRALVPECVAYDWVNVVSRYDLGFKVQILGEVTH